MTVQDICIILERVYTRIGVVVDKNDDGRKVGQRERGVEIRTSQTWTSLLSTTTITAEMYPLVIVYDWKVYFVLLFCSEKGWKKLQWSTI